MNLPEGFFLKNRKYQLSHAIGQGGFGITYKGALNTEVKGALGTIKTQVPVCIKEYFFKDYCYRDPSYAVNVHSQTGEKLFNKFKEKLIQEANILSAVHHPHIVNVLEVFEENNTAYIVMEFIQGCSLKYMLDTQGVLDENKALKYIHQTGNALDFVHNKNIVHLDVKPGNILIDRNDNARLIDFGVSKRYDIDEQQASTTVLTLSKGFASIEQYDEEGTHNFSPCPDIYSLGATLYNILTGVVPIEAILRVTKQLPPPRSYNPSISERTERAILRAMEVHPAARFQTVKDMLASLDIPPYEFRESEQAAVGGGATSAASSADDDDITLIKGAKSKNSDDDETRFGGRQREDTSEVTAAAAAAAQEAETRRRATTRRRRKVTLVAALLALCALMAYGVYYFLDNRSADETVKQTASTAVTGIDSNLKWHKVTQAEPIIKDEVVSAPDNQQVKRTGDNLSANGGSAAQRQAAASSATTAAANTTAATQPDDSSSIVAADNEQKYNELITNARRKMSVKQYAEAITDLEQASTYRTTIDIFNLMQECKDAIDKSAAEERLSRYDMMNRSIRLGEYIVVRNRSTMLFGAIDEKGNEVVPCKYKTFSPYSDGKAFLRSDSLYDAYNSRAMLTEAGMTEDKLIE
jgi:serine/threonine-protein kinase